MVITGDLMAVTVQQLLTDAKRLVTRLKDHESEADNLISHAQNLNNSLETMKEFNDEIQQLNSLAHQRPRSALILNIQQENRHIRELQQENRELRAMLEEHQSALDLIMNKYRQQVLKIVKAQEVEKEWIEKDNKVQELTKRSEKIAEMAMIMQKAIEIDDQNFQKEQEMSQKLAKENQLLRAYLDISRCREGTLTSKLCRTDEGVQTDL